MPVTVNILIYEDDEALRDSLAGILKMNVEFQVLQTFADAKNVLADLHQYKPDLILTDIGMPNVNGIELVKCLRQAGSTIPIIVLTVFEDNENILEAIQAGASGYILKKHIPERLTSAIHEVLNGGAPMSPSVARMVIKSMQKPIGKSYQLTPRELEILASLTKGNSYKLVAAEVGVSIDTVRTHIKGIYSKLQVHSQSEATAKAIKERLI